MSAGALEEVGQPYKVRLLPLMAMKEPAHLTVHPFGQIPTHEERDLALFETGAIVFHIAERHAGLLPDEAYTLARHHLDVRDAQPPVLDLTAELVDGDRPWAAERLPLVTDRIRTRLDQRWRPDDTVRPAPAENVGSA